MLPSLLGAFGAALCYGVGSLLEAIAARSSPASETLDPRLFLRLVRSWRYLLGAGLDVVGFVLAVAAVRSLPLFVVQSIVASSLAVTAVLGAYFLQMRLGRSDKVALGLVVGGLVLVGLSAAPDRTVEASDVEQWGVLAVSILLVVAAGMLGRLPAAAGAAALGAVAGLAFGATAVAARMIPESLSIADLLSEPGGVLASPATYALVVAAPLALLSYSTALQRGSITQATAPLVVCETVGPALVGIGLLGDQARHGWEWVAVLGFVVSVGGAVGLSRREAGTEAPPPVTVGSQRG